MIAMAETIKTVIDDGWRRRTSKSIQNRISLIRYFEEGINKKFNKSKFPFDGNFLELTERSVNEWFQESNKVIEDIRQHLILNGTPYQKKVLTDGIGGKK